MRFLLTLLILIWTEKCSSQIPFYYHAKKVHGILYSEDGDSMLVRICSRNKIEFEGGSCDQQKFLKTLMIHRHGRKELEHLLTTSSKITLIISDKVGIRLEGGKYRLIAGITGPQKQQSYNLISETKRKNRITKTQKPNFVFERNTLEIFKGSIEYAWSRAMVIDTSNVKLFVFEQHEPVVNFSMDTIFIEPLAHPELMYRNIAELFYFAGIHEIYHTRAENIYLSIYGEDAETPAYRLERKLFRKRKLLNRRFKKRL